MKIHLLTRVLTLATMVGSGLVSATVVVAEPLRLASVFTDNAVLQRGQTVPIWGKGEPGQTIVVAFAGQEKSAKVDKDGRWMARLDAVSASAKGQTLTAKSGSEVVAIGNVLIGEVWVCSGQSNMAFGLGGSVNGKAAIAAAGDDQLRLFNARAQATDEPQESIGGSWAVDSSQSAGSFSAVGYYFGKALRKKLGVPVGLIKSAVGGTVAEAWTAREELEKNPTLTPLLDLQQQRLDAYPKILAAYKDREPQILAKYEAAVKKAKADGARAPRKPQPPAHPSANKNRPIGLYNGSIAPLQPYSIKGAIWYQGESNSSRGEQYRTLFPAMISSWRRAWGQGDFPFLFVQITPHRGMTPEVREAQRVTTETTQNTAMAVTTDIGHPTDIHPKQKQPIGERLALAARAMAYEENIEFSGPTYDSMSVDGNRVVINLKHVGGGLVAKGGELKGFVIYGKDKEAVGMANIDGNTIVVSSDGISDPVGVRYGWANVPDVNLYNKAGLPASPFQTDGAYEPEPGFESLLTGHDVTGWRYKDGPEFDGMKSASDGRYTGRDGRIVVNPGKGLAQLWSTREFAKNFHLKLEFRAGVNADSGIFLRKPQLQCRDYYVAGPYKELKNYRPQDWNEIEVIVKGDVATCTCNGEPLDFPKTLPATGPIGLEADRGQMEYRRIRIRELK
ncbi:MAG: sialate O-acetylesterase [Planctomycetales bacterium]